ncbi:hypothetical protein Rhopal_001427-T1 [Rhodotorula paludigena]|uniref:Transcriptional regulator Ngg1 n=1 Tax=Rhodotorula paludigena TaxID=86838 RepID=A0AAV5G7C6_9BASI|nr:hypothetical protein Rhopal_001427-T1 [Rhodotorula paludigena]
MAPPPHPGAPAPPAPSASPASEFLPFNIPPPPPPNAPIRLCAQGTGPIPSSDLSNLYASLTLSRMVANNRKECIAANRALLAARTGPPPSASASAGAAGGSDEAVRGREASERKRRRDEEDARRERERSEKAERERAERVREEEQREQARRAQQQKQQERQQAQQVKPEPGDDDRKVRDSKDKQRAVDVLQIVQTNEAQRRTDGDGDTSMGDASAAPSSRGTPSGTATPASKASAKGARSQVVSPDLEDEVAQPKPPRHSDRKKRKRDHVVDSDASDSDDDRPLLQKNGIDGSTLIERKLKEERFTKHSIPIKPPAPGSASAFYVPSVSLAPPRPPAVPPPPTPKRQADVSGDFSNAKPGQQIAHSTFTNWVDAYLRPFGEDDLAFLAAKPEDMSPYLIPPLGKHYLDRWEEEDTGGAPASGYYVSPLEPPVLPRLRPDALTEDALQTENVFLGPLSERLMAALAVGGSSAAGALEDEGANGAGEGAGDDAAPPQPKLQLDAVDLEERVKRELRYLGVLPDEEVDWSSREDDEISAALRACQRLLHQQTELNEARKAVLQQLVKDRMAYQDYETARDAQERVIEAGWTKRMRVDVKKKKKGKERDRRPGGGGGAAAGGAGAGDGDPSKAPVSADLVEAVEKRDRLVSTFKPFFEEDGGDRGRFFGLPETSVYEELEGLLDDEEPASGGGAVAAAPV